MIRIIDDQTKRFIDFLNQNYGTEAECIVSVFNCQDSVCVSEDGKEEQSLFIPKTDSPAGSKRLAAVVQQPANIPNLRVYGLQAEKRRKDNKRALLFIGE